MVLVWFGFIWFGEKALEKKSLAGKVSRVSIFRVVEKKFLHRNEKKKLFVKESLELVTYNNCRWLIEDDVLCIFCVKNTLGVSLKNTWSRLVLQTACMRQSPGVKEHYPPPPGFGDTK